MTEMAKRKIKMQPDLGYIGKDGKLHDDGLHDEMLNNPEADKRSRQLAFDYAIGAGVSEATARQLYGDDLTASAGELQSGCIGEPPHLR